MATVIKIKLVEMFESLANCSWRQNYPSVFRFTAPEMVLQVNKYIISAYDSGRAHFWGHETDPKVAPLFCPQSFAERCCDGCFFH